MTVVPLAFDEMKAVLVLQWLIYNLIASTQEPVISLDAYGYWLGISRTVISYTPIIYSSVVDWFVKPMYFESNKMIGLSTSLQPISVGLSLQNRRKINNVSKISNLHYILFGCIVLFSALLSDGFWWISYQTKGKIMEIDKCQFWNLKTNNTIKVTDKHWCFKTQTGQIAF